MLIQTAQKIILSHVHWQESNRTQSSFKILFLYYEVQQAWMMLLEDLKRKRSIIKVFQQKLM